MCENSTKPPDWDDIVASLWPVLLKWADAMMPSCLRARLAPEDLVQKTLSEVQTHTAKLVAMTEDERRGYLRSALKNNVKDELRKRANGDVPLDALVASSVRVLDWVSAEDTSPSERASRNERAGRLAERLAQLPDAQRVAVVLKHLEGRSLREIADQLGRSEDAVSQLLHRAILTLRHALRELKE